MPGLVALSFFDHRQLATRSVLQQRLLLDRLSKQAISANHPNEFLDPFDNTGSLFALFMHT